MTGTGPLTRGIGVRALAGAATTHRTASITSDEREQRPSLVMVPSSAEDVDSADPTPYPCRPASRPSDRYHYSR